MQLKEGPEAPDWFYDPHRNPPCFGWIGKAFPEHHPERAEQASLLRCIFGNPFRPVTLDPFWNTSTVLSLAQRMYGSRDFSPMPILADALQDAGCDNPDFLNHCRGGGPHARGRWVVDQLLGFS